MSLNIFFLDTIQSAYSTTNITDSKFETIVKEWFRGASQRYAREINKK